MTSYFIKLPGQPSWTKVSKTSFVAVERHCGFTNSRGESEEPATAGFGSPFGEGRVRGDDDDGVEPVEIDFEVCTAMMRVPDPERTGYCVVGATKAVVKAVTKEMNHTDAQAIVKIVASIHRCMHLTDEHPGDHLCACGTSWEEQLSSPATF